MVLVVLIIGITTLLLESNPVNNVDMATKKKSPTYTEQSYLPDYGPFYNNQGQLPEGFNGPFRSILPADVQGPLAPGQIRSSTPTDFGTNAFASFNDAGTAATTATTSTDYGIKTLPDGRTFDLNNPEQRLAYSQALSQILGVQRDQALAQLDNAFKTNDKQAVNQYQTYLSQLDQNLADIEAGAKKYASDYATTLQGFNEGKQAGDVGRQNYFATISRCF
jgi:hypothetical protein